MNCHIYQYKNQQREFEFQLKDQKGVSKISVLTIDQCQGQEADAVILSLVQRLDSQSAQRGTVPCAQEAVHPHQL